MENHVQREAGHDTGTGALGSRGKCREVFAERGAILTITDLKTKKHLRRLYARSKNIRTYDTFSGATISPISETLIW